MQHVVALWDRDFGGNCHFETASSQYGCQSEIQNSAIEDSYLTIKHCSLTQLCTKKARENLLTRKCDLSKEKVLERGETLIGVDLTLTTCLYIEIQGIVLKCTCSCLHHKQGLNMDSWIHHRLWPGTCITAALNMLKFI